MLKFKHHLSKTNLVLIRKQLGDGSCAALVVLRVPQRFYNDPPNPCPPPTATPKKHKLLYGTLAAAVITGSFVVYAKSSPQTRNWLASNVPVVNNFIALVYQENTTYGQFFMNTLKKSSAFASSFLFGKEGITPMEMKTRPEQDLDKDALEQFASKTYELPPKKIEPLYTEELTMEPITDISIPAKLIHTEVCEPQTPPKVVISKDMVELEQDMHEHTKLAIDRYKEATNFSQAYNKALIRLIETPVDEADSKTAAALSTAGKSRAKTLKEAQDSAKKARAAIGGLERIFEAGVSAPPDTIFQTKRFIKTFQKDLKAAEDTYNAEVEKGVMSEKYWNKVQAAREAYKKELELLFPGIDLAARKLDVKEDTDLLLLYTLRQVASLQNEIAELQTVRDMKLTQAISNQNEKAIIDAKVEDAYKKELLKKFEEFHFQNLQVQADFSKKLRDALQRQADVHHDLLNYRLQAKENEILANFGRLMNEKMQDERLQFKKELAAMAGKLAAIEQTIRERAYTEEEARRSQSVWAAAEALLAATKRNTPEVKINNELKALENAGKGDKLVQTVLKSIPDEAAKSGVVTDRTLKLSFEEMCQTAKKVALIGRDGATLPIYFLSWLQSKLLFSKTEIPSDELENKPTDFAELDTFDIIQRAQYHMARDNIADALRYINLLQGAPRAAARCWIESAKRHLEVKQAAEAVMAHASVSGLLYM